MQRCVYILAVLSLVLLTPLSVRGSQAAPAVGQDPPGVSVFHGNPARTPSNSVPYQRPPSGRANPGASRQVAPGGNRRHARTAAVSGCAPGWMCQDIGTPPTPGSSSFDGTTWTVSGSGGPGGTYDSFQFASMPWGAASTATISAHIIGMTNSGFGNNAGIMIRDGTSPSANLYMAEIDASGNVSVSSRDGTGGIGGSNAGPVVAHYIQVRRDGFTFTTYTSATGADGSWTPVPDSSIGTATMGVDVSTMDVGIFVTSSSSSLNTATFDGVSISGGGSPVTDCANGWQCQDIGDPSPTGSQQSTVDGKAWVLNGTGCGLMYCPGDGKPDQFRFAWVPLGEGATMTARITFQSNQNGGSLNQAGIMFRQNTSGTAKYDGIFAWGGHGIVVRTPAGQCNGTITRLPAYVSLTWSGGNSFTAKESVDGTTWDTIPCPFSGAILFSGAVLGGLVDSGTDLVTGSFGDVTVQGALGPSASEVNSVSEHTTSCDCADPVNGANGAFSHTFSDMSIPGRGMPLALTHTYRSLLATQDSPLGFGWTDSYNMFLSTGTDGAITVHEAGGTAVTFQPNGSGGYQAPSRVMARLTTNSDGTLTFTRIHGGDQYVFSAPTPSTAGQLLREVDRNGYATSLSYTNGQLATVTDPAGRTLTFHYNAANRISQISDSCGRSETFSYDSSGNLTDVTDTRQGTWHFSYDGNHLLLTMEDPRQYALNGPLSTGPVTTNIYDPQGRVIRQTDPMQRAFQFAYSMTAGGLHQTQVTDPRGTVTIEQYQDNELQTLIRGYGTLQQAEWDYQYDPATLGVTQVIDPRTHVWNYSYDANGNLLTAQQPQVAGESSRRTATYTYNSLNEPLTVTDPRNLVTTYSYDTNGNLTSASRPAPAGSQPQLRSMARIRLQSVRPPHRGMPMRRAPHQHPGHGRLRASTSTSRSRRHRASPRSVTQLVNPPSSSAYGRAVLADHPVAYWRLDETSGTTAADSSGNGNDLTYHGVTLGQAGGISGDPDSAASLAGTTTSYLIGNPFTSMPSTAFTVEGWVKTTATAGNGRGLFSYATSTNDNRMLLYDPSNLTLTDGSNFRTTNVAVNDGQWHDLVWTWRASDGQTLLYKDGALVWSGTLTKSSIPGGGSVVLGQDQDSVGGGFDGTQAYEGSLDDIALYSTALSASQIQAHYTAGTSRYANVVAADNPVANWRLDDASGGTAADSSGNGNSLTYQGVTLGQPGALEGDTDAAVSLAGTTTSYLIGNPFNAIPSTALSVEVWVKTTATAGSGRGIVSYAIPGNDNRMLLYDPTDLKITDGSNFRTSNVAVNDGQWHQLVLTWRATDGQTLLYKDGALAYSTALTKSSIPNGGSLVLGQDQDSVGGGFDGLQAYAGTLDEVSLYATALSASQVQAHYAAGSTGTSPTSTPTSTPTDTPVPTGTATAPATATPTSTPAATATATATPTATPSATLGPSPNCPATTPVAVPADTQETVLTYGDSSHPGDVTSVQDPDHDVTTIGYDSNGNVSAVCDPLGNETTYGYDSAGRVTSMVSPTGNAAGGGPPASYTTLYGYNPVDELTSVTDPLQHQTMATYDENGNLSTVTDARQNPATVYTYNADNQLSGIARSDGTSLGYSYDDNGNLASEADGLTQTTTYDYDPLNRVDLVTDPLQRQTGYSYDGNGNLLTLTSPRKDANGTDLVTTATYDQVNELSSISYSDGSTPSIGYTDDPDGQPATMTDGTGTTSYTFDILNRLSQSTDGAGNSVGYGYDLANNLTSITYPGSVGSVTRSFDPDNRLKTVSDWLSHTTSFGYDPTSNLTSEVYPNSITATYSYNNADQLTGIADTRNGNPIWTFGYSRDAMGQVQSASDPVDGSSHTYGYNQLNQLISDQQAGGTLTWSYDAADQLKATTNGVTGISSSAGYDAGGQLSSYAQTGPTGPLASLTFSFNADGDRTGSSDSVTGITTTYGYDQADELTSYTSGNTSASYRYNGDGLRTSKTVNGTTTNQVWDLAEGLPVIIQDGSTKEITGPGGLPIEQVAGDGTVLYYLQDQLGSTRGLIDQSGSVVATYSYDAYGNPTSGSGSESTPFQYAGQYTDSESGLQYLRARYYDPQTAQFLKVDPLAAITQQPYAYTVDNPTNFGDPSGLCDTPFGSAPFGSSNNCSDDTGAALHNAVAGIYVLPPSHIPAVARPGTINFDLTHDQPIRPQGCGSGPNPGDVVWRIWGGGSPPEGHSWTPVDPRTLSNARDTLGLPDANAGTNLTKARVVNPGGITVRPAEPYYRPDGTLANKGGGPEYLVAEPSSDLTDHEQIPVDFPF